MNLPAQTMDQPPTAPDDPASVVFTPYRRTQLLVVVASVVSFLLVWTAGRWIGIPVERGFQDSLLQQPNWFFVILTTYALIGCAWAVGTLIAGRSWFFAGLFVAAIGLTALSARGGPMRYVLFEAANHGATQGIFLRLALEQCLLFLPMAAIWTLLWRRYRSAIRPETDKKVESAAPAALIAQIAATGIAVLLLAPTDAKQQVLIGVFLGSLVGAALADYLFPDAEAPAWFWVGPFAVGFIGYLLAYFNAMTWTTGSPGGVFAALARPLPLDYASAGVAGALLGYWMGGERQVVAFSLRKRPPAAPEQDRTNLPGTPSQGS